MPNRNLVSVNLTRYLRIRNPYLLLLVVFGTYKAVKSWKWQDITREENEKHHDGEVSAMSSDELGCKKEIHA
ncbi:MAG: hypothetical protein MMC33_006434 [Icmadophila ericetorum]|nr:hypothetical protein [Icmadophila ericetorum]